jgi:hypothetical protein
MKSSVRYIGLLLAAVMTAGLPACNNKLDIKPSTGIVPGQIQTAQDVEAALIGAYTNLQQFDAYGEQYYLIADLLANDQEIAFGGYATQYLEVNSKSQLKGSLIAEQLWAGGYRTINSVNLVLSKSHLLSATNKDRITAEAKLIRGITYFMLSGFYGKPYAAGNLTTNLTVPLIVDPVLSKEDLEKVKLPRATVAAMHAQIEADLKAAATHLAPDNGTRANKFTAFAFLSRLYLAEGKYGEAAAMADSVISSQKFNLNQVYEKAFNNASNTTEDIFAIQQTAQSSGGSSNNGLITFYTSYPSGRGDAQVNEKLLDLYEDGDSRKDFIYDGWSSSGISGKHTGKWVMQGTNIPVVRLAEMYLTRAEANLRAGTVVGDTPLNDVNAVRGRSHASILGSVTANKIVEERFRELVFEGDKFWTVKRLKLSVGDKAYDHPKLILPVPEREILLNTKLEQNEDYK